MCAPVLEWHTEQNRKLRSVGEALEWEVSQQQGSWLKHVENILGKLIDTGSDSLEAVGLVVPLTASFLICNSLDSGEAMFMNQIASLYGDMVVSLAGFRVRTQGTNVTHASHVCKVIGLQWLCTHTFVLVTACMCVVV